jgi:serine/threonine-protein kinase HipA
MAIDQLDVYLNGRYAGAVRQGPGDRLSFVYDDDYRSDPRATPLSCALPLTAATHQDARIRPYLWGLLPDNERVLDRWARQFQVSARRPLELLLAVGRDLPGAVEMLSSGQRPVIDPGDVAWLSEDDVAAELRRVREDEAAWLPAQGRGRWSLGGAHAKVALIFRDGRWGRPGGGTPTNRILKPAIAELADHDVNEHLCLTAARLCGLPAVPSSIASFGQERAMVVTRFDRRIRSDGTVERIHQEDMCQALAVSPSNKYESDQGPTAARIARLLAEEIGAPEGRKAVRSFFDALVFNWVIAGPDAHAKNFSLLHLGRSVRLAPLYDIGSALPYPDYYGPKVKLAMRVGGHYRVGAISAKTWAKEAQALGLHVDEAVESARLLTQNVPDAFCEARKKSGLKDEATGFADRLVDAVARNAAFCLTRLG